jgi:putative endonuclease
VNVALKDARGRAGEALAAAYLALAGLRVVDRNPRIAGVEVDLVAEDRGVTVLVEVKARSRSDFGGAAHAVDARKRERLRRAALAAARGARGVRVDVVTVELEADGARLRHYRNAVES